MSGRRSVEITVHRGVVHLTGVVASHAQKWAIDRAVRRIVGVKDLCDYLHVRPPPLRGSFRLRPCRAW